MSKFQYGLQKFEIGDMDPITGAITNKREVKLYQDSVVIDRPAQTATQHFAQGDPNAKVTRYSKTAKSVSGTVFDRSADSKVEWLGGTKTTVNITSIATLGSVTGGADYTPGTYLAVPLTGGAGTGATANITVNSSGAVTTVTIIDPGSGYQVSDALSASTAVIGSGGAGFTVSVATITTTPKDTWHEPESGTPGITRKAFILTYEDGSVAIGPNMSVAARDSWNPNDTDVAGIPFVATVTSTGVPGVSAWQETDA